MKKLLSILMLSMILFGCSNNQKKSQRVLIDALIDKGTQEISSFYYKSELFNGIAFDVYPNGKLSQEYPVKNGKIDGLYKTYYENGKLKRKASYRNGLLNGLVKNWNEDGQLEEYNYEDGQLVRIQTEINTKPVEEEIIEEQIESTEEIVTRTTIDALKVKKPEKKKKKPKEEVIKEKKQKVNEKAIYPGKKKTTITSEGNEKGVGNQGTIGGDSNPDADLGDLGNGGNGNEYQLGNRNPIVLPKPIYDSEAEGKVVVHIIVDQLGNVISAKPGEKGTTTQNKQLLANAKEAALKTKYPPKADAPNQHGKLIYTFQ